MSADGVTWTKIAAELGFPTSNAAKEACELARQRVVRELHRSQPTTIEDLGLDVLPDDVQAAVAPHVETKAVEVLTAYLHAPDRRASDVARAWLEGQRTFAPVAQLRARIAWGVIRKAQGNHAWRDVEPPAAFAHRRPPKGGLTRRWNHAVVAAIFWGMPKDRAASVYLETVERARAGAGLSDELQELAIGIADEFYENDRGVQS
jgi:hypothetical protein